MSDDIPGPLWSSLLFLFLLILINAFFAAAEIAVLSLNESIVKRQADAGDAAAKNLLRMIQSPGPFLSTIQIGITLVGFLASAFAASTFANRFAQTLIRWGVAFIKPATLEGLSVVLITMILSFFTLVFGELVPKRIAMQYAYKVARLTSGIIRGLSAVAKPAVWLLSAATNVTLRLFGIDPDRDAEEVTEEGIRLMVDIGEEKGVIEAEEAELIENIFDFNNLTAEDVMVHRTDVSALYIEDTHEDIVKMILSTGFSRFPVYNEDLDDIIGVLNLREYLLNVQSETPKPFCELVRPAYFVPETVRADVLFRDMQRRKTHMAIVVDEYGGTSGIVTMEDLLEEIVGDIFDEFDPLQEIPIAQLEPNLWRVSGSVDLETLSEALDVKLPLDEEFDTLGGLVYSCLNAIPEEGATPVVTAYGLRVQVEKIEDRRIDSTLVSKVEEKE